MTKRNERTARVSVALTSGGRTMKYRHWTMLFAVAALIVAVIGCTRTTPVEAPPEPPTTAESLMTGAWQFTVSDSYRDREGLEVAFTETATLTFTPSRWLVHIAWEDSTERSGDYVNSGGWTVTGANTLDWGRWIWGEEGREQESSSKEFYWGNEERTELFVNTWHAVDTRYFQRWTSVTATSADVVGTWHGEENFRTRSEGEIEFTPVTVLRLMEVGADTFKHTETRIDPREGRSGEQVLAGTLEVDEAERFLWVTVAQVTYNGVPVDADHPLLGTRTRWAYYIWGDKMYLSFYWYEMDYDGDTEKWIVGDPEFPYGHYVREMDSGPRSGSANQSAEVHHPSPYGGFRLSEAVKLSRSITTED